MKSILIFVSAMFLFGCGAGTPTYYHEKYSAPIEKQKPLQTPKELIVQKQIEEHTCGYHALSSIYLAHGINPDLANLRFRLGVDKAAIPFDDSTLGSIHPDIYRVASQDGFFLSALEPSVERSRERLCHHIGLGLYALALVSIEESGGGLHWVVIGGCSEGNVMVFDSLHPQPYRRDLDKYFEEELLSLILINPIGLEINVWDGHKDGIIEMNKVRIRMKEQRG